MSKKHEKSHDLELLAVMYHQRRPLFERAGRQLTMVLEDLVHDLSPLEGLRPRLVEFRVKDFDSLSQKALLSGWNPSETFDKVRDLVGCRVVCNNKSDIRKLLKRLGELEGDIRLIPGEVHDNLDEPTPSGYRGVHALVEIGVMHGATRTTIRGEIQLRTVLQDAWAVLAHDDIYKRKNSPELVQRLFVLVSEQLDTVQQTVDLLREELDRAAALHEGLIVPLLNRVETAITSHDLKMCQSLLELVAPYLDHSWKTFLKTRVEQKRGEFGPDLGTVAGVLDAIWDDPRNSVELRARALIARCEIPDKGYGGPIPELIVALHTVIERYNGKRDSVSPVLVSEAWFWVGELERHRKNWASAQEAYEKASILSVLETMHTMVLHRRALVARMLGDEDLSAELLRKALEKETADVMIRGAIHRDLAIHNLRIYQRTLNLSRLDEAERNLTQSIELLRETIDRAGLAVSLAKFGRVQIFRGKYAEAQELLAQALKMLQHLDNRLFEAMTLTDLCQLKCLQQNDEMEEEILRLRELTVLDRSHQAELQCGKYLGQALWYRGRVLLQKNNLAVAAEAFMEDMSLNIGSGEKWQKVVDGIATALREFKGNHCDLVKELRVAMERFPNISVHHLQEVLLQSGYPNDLAL